MEAVLWLIKPVYFFDSPGSLRYKIIDLRELLDCVDIDFISISETKLVDSFPSVQLIMIVIFCFGGIEINMVEVGRPAGWITAGYQLLNVTKVQKST